MASAHISASKLTRIDIWRTEVAAHTLTNTTTNNSNTPVTPSSSSSSGHSSSTYNSQDPAASHTRPRDAKRRPRSFWRRIARRITRRSGADFDYDDLDYDAWEDGVRTDMYRTELATELLEGPARREELMLVGDEDRSDAGRGDLKEKQMRLERAARLLEQGLARNGLGP